MARLDQREKIEVLEQLAQRAQTAMIAAWLAAHPVPQEPAEGGLALILPLAKVAGQVALIYASAQTVG